jgi:hypothetical protein
VFVRVPEVAGIDAPRAIAWRRCQSRARCLGLCEQGIDRRSALDRVSDAELARLGFPERNRRVLGELSARVESEDESASEVEHHDGPCRLDVAANELGADHAIGFEPETVAIERERPLQVRDCERYDVNTGLHCCSRLDLVSRRLVLSQLPDDRTLEFLRLEPERAFATLEGDAPIGADQIEAVRPAPVR